MKSNYNIDGSVSSKFDWLSGFSSGLWIYFYWIEIEGIPISLMGFRDIIADPEMFININSLFSLEKLLNF